MQLLITPKILTINPKNTLILLSSTNKQGWKEKYWKEKGLTQKQFDNLQSVDDIVKHWCSCESCKKINELINLKPKDLDQRFYSGKITELEYNIAKEGTPQDPKFERFFGTTRYCSACSLRGLGYE